MREYLCSSECKSNISSKSSSTKRLKILQRHLTPKMTSTSGFSSAAQDVLNTRQQIPVLDSTISYLDTKDTSPNDRTVIFLHGNPLAAFSWRNVIPNIQHVARCLAPDLLGFGHSGLEPNNNYRYRDQYRYISAWIEKMNINTKISFVASDWGCALAFQWSNENRERAESVTFMEGVTGVIRDWDALDKSGREGIQLFRSPAGEDMVLKQNMLLEMILANAFARELTEEEMEEYRRPFKEPGESRRPMAPIRTAGPQDVVDIVDAFVEWLVKDEKFPKLFLNAKPGFYSAGHVRQFEKQPWPNMKTVEVNGKKYPQEDCPDEIGKAVIDFLTKDVFPKSK